MANQYLSKIKIPGITDPLIIKDIEAHNLISQLDTNKLSKCIEVTYSELKSLRDNSQLVAGQMYRITDYVTTTVQSGTQSANHAFDIIVTADDVNKLNENARTIQHDGDTYFDNSKLEAWEIKYCLDNDTSRFAWADNTNGKGVIYYMKDEFGNECPYDFKNIQYIKKIGFTAFDQYGSSYTTTYSRYETNDTTVSGTAYYGFKRIYYIPGPGPMAEYIWTTTTALTTSISLYNVSGGNVSSVTGTITKVNTENFITYTFDKNGSEASISGDSESVTENTIAPYSNNNKQTLNSIYFRSTSSNLSVYGNNFNVNCHDMTFSHHCYNNTFGINNYGNSFGHSCYDNSFGSGCDDNSFGNECTSNSFGNNCDANSFDNACRSNSFGNNCRSNSFGYNCDNNSFGNVCDSNSFGNYCDYNSFGNNCYSITFSKQYTQFVIVENGNRYITLTSTQTTSNNNYLRNITIAQGVNNTTTQKTISHNTVNDTFKTTYQSVNSQVISV